MRILDRYILKSIIGIFLGMVFTFALLFILIDTFGNLQDFIEKKVPVETVVQYYLTFLPMIFVNSATLACLISVLFTYSNLSNNNEIVAIRSSGMNFWQITKPAIVFSILVCASIFLLNECFVPSSFQVNQEIRDAKIKITNSEKSKGLPVIKNLTLYGQKNRLFFVDSYDPNTKTLNGITIIGHDQNQTLVEKVVALKGVWTGLAWKFYNCQITSYNSTLPNITGDVKIYPERLMDLKESPQDFIKQRLDVNAMNLKQLGDYISRFSGSGAIKTINNLKVDYYSKFSLPLRPLLIVLVGLPFALTSAGKRKAATFASIGIALSIGFLYYVIDAVGLALGKGGALPPWSSAFVAPAIFFLLAVISINSKR